MVFCNIKIDNLNIETIDVTILILIDGFLQYGNGAGLHIHYDSHNPYFNRWFSAI